MTMDLTWLLPAGRALVGLAFLVAGIRNARAFAVLKPLLATLGVPLPGVALMAGIAIQVIAGALLALGFWVRPAALALALFIVVATLIFHRFWEHEGPERLQHVNTVISNAALLGTFLLLAGLG